MFGSDSQLINPANTSTFPGLVQEAKCVFDYLLLMCDRWIVEAQTRHIEQSCCGADKQRPSERRLEVEQPTVGHAAEDDAAASRQVLTRPLGTFLTSGPPEDMDGSNAEA